MIGTSDGGCHFQEIYQGQWSFKQIDFPDNVYGFALASVEEGQARYLIATTSGGSEWKRISNQTSFFVGFSPAAEKVAVGRSYHGGKQWVNLPAIAGYEGIISFVDSKAGWLAVRGQDHSSLYMTKDGGATWELEFSLKY